MQRQAELSTDANLSIFIRNFVIKYLLTFARRIIVTNQAERQPILLHEKYLQYKILCVIWSNLIFIWK